MKGKCMQMNAKRKEHEVLVKHPKPTKQLPRSLIRLNAGGNLLLHNSSFTGNVGNPIAILQCRDGLYLCLNLRWFNTVLLTLHHLLGLN